MIWFLVVFVCSTALCCDRAVVFNSTTTNKLNATLSSTEVMASVNVTEMTVELRFLLQRKPISYAALLGNWQSSGLGLNICAGGFIEATVYDAVSLQFLENLFLNRSFL